MYLTDLQLNLRLEGEKLNAKESARQLPNARTLECPVESACAPNELVGDLLAMLDAESIRYCHWKSNWQIKRWLRGEGDLDLLISSADVCKFTYVVSRLGFKKVLPPPEKDLPGVLNFYGYDAKSQKLIHIHAHYQLVFGHDLTKNYRLPIESSLLELSVAHGAIAVTSPEIELIIFVVRMVLKYSAAEAVGRRVLGKSARFSTAIEKEIEYLETQVKPAQIDVALWRHFPIMSKDLFNLCLASLRPEATVREQFRAKRKLERALAAHARQTRFVEPFVKVQRRISAARDKVLRKKSRKRFESGGVLIAFVGGDGAGKSTCVEQISKWLSKKFQTKAIHIGKPPQSVLTKLVAAALKARRQIDKFSSRNKPVNEFGASPASDFLQHLRWLCTARDRYRLYEKACRFTANGGIIICDRYPVQQVQLMDSPKIARSLSVVPHTGIMYRLIELEKWYYRQIMLPDLLVVLRVHPDTAVRRKTDEPAEHVRPRSAELWQANWQDTGAHLVDTNRKLPEVLADLRSLVWEAL